MAVHCEGEEDIVVVVVVAAAAARWGSWQLGGTRRGLGSRAGVRDYNRSGGNQQSQNGTLLSMWATQRSIVQRLRAVGARRVCVCVAGLQNKSQFWPRPTI